MVVIENLRERVIVTREYEWGGGFNGYATVFVRGLRRVNVIYETNF